MLNGFLGVYCLIAASFSTCLMNWNEDVAIFVTRSTHNMRSKYFHQELLLKVKSKWIFMTKIILFSSLKVSDREDSLGLWGEIDKDPEDVGTCLLLRIGLRICCVQELQGHWPWLQCYRPSWWHHHWPSPGLHFAQRGQSHQLGKVEEIVLRLRLLPLDGPRPWSQSYRVTESYWTDLSSRL